jgi:serine/threonine protein kinase
LIDVPVSLEPGHCLGPYRIESFLAAGGMGEVYRATDTRLHREVAIKVSAARFSERFEREARVIASLNHPNICQLYDVGPNYLVMELVEGPTLAERIRKGAVPLDDALGIARQIAEALEAAHEKGIVHRDLKPGNVKVTPDGHVIGFRSGESGRGTDCDRQRQRVAYANHVSHTRRSNPGHGSVHESRARARGRGGQAVGHLVVRRGAV